jgi:hypothetical protein
MKAKLFTVVDDVGYYNVLAVKLEGETADEKALLQKSGFTANKGYVTQLTELESGETHQEPDRWVDNLTLRLTHTFISENYDDLESGYTFRSIVTMK